MQREYEDISPEELEEEACWYFNNYGQIECPRCKMWIVPIEFNCDDKFCPMSGDRD